MTTSRNGFIHFNLKNEYSNILTEGTGLNIAEINGAPFAYFENPDLKDGEHSFYVTTLTLPKGARLLGLFSADGLSKVNDNAVLEENFQFPLIFNITTPNNLRNYLISSKPVHDLFHSPSDDEDSRGTRVGCEGCLVAQNDSGRGGSNQYAVYAIGRKWLVPFLLPNLATAFVGIDSRNENSLKEIALVQDTAAAQHTNALAFPFLINADIALNEDLGGILVNSLQPLAA